MGSKVVSYKVYATSVLSYVMQYVDIPKNLLQLEASCIARVLNIPRNSIPCEVALGLQVVGQPSFPSLRHLAAATLARSWMALRCSSEVEALVVNSMDNIDPFLNDPVKRWAETSMVATMCANYKSIVNLRVPPPSSARSVQAGIYAALCGEADSESIGHCVACRIHTITDEVEATKEDLIASSGIAFKHLQQASQWIVPAGAQAWVKALFNAWTTSYRFGGVVQPCPFCAAEASDSLNHYAKCPVLNFYGSELLPDLWAHGYSMISMHRCLGIDAFLEGPAHLPALLAAWIDAVHWTSLIHSRAQHVDSPIHTLAARLKVFLLRMCKGANRAKVLSDSCRLSAASMSQWT